MNMIKAQLLEKVAGIRSVPAGAYNIRENGGCAGRANSQHVSIESKFDGSGINIYVRSGAKGEKVYIPVLIDKSGLIDVVRNDFYIEDHADVTIIAGCGIHSEEDSLTQHDGIHAFHIGRHAKVRYEEKHYASGLSTGKKVLNPVTEVEMKEWAYFEMDTVQIEGVDETKRITNAKIEDNASFIVREKLMTHKDQKAETEFNVDLCGLNSSVHLMSRAVAKEKSQQIFVSQITGNNPCAGRSECDAIIMDEAMVKAIPQITANHVDASLVHEATIGKIAGEQLIKLMSLGLTKKEAEQKIINGFLK